MLTYKFSHLKSHFKQELAANFIFLKSKYIFSCYVFTYAVAVSLFIGIAS